MSIESRTEKGRVMAQINWTEDEDEHGLSIWEGMSPYWDEDIPFCWRLRQKSHTEPEKFEAVHTSELMGLTAAEWETVQDSILEDIASEGNKEGGG